MTFLFYSRGGKGCSYRIFLSYLFHCDGFPYQITLEVRGAPPAGSLSCLQRDPADPQLLPVSALHIRWWPLTPHNTAALLSHVASQHFPQF